LLAGDCLILGAGITVFFDPVMHALGRHPESLGDLADLVSPVRNLLYCLDLELFWIAYTTHIQYLLFASIVTLSDIYDTRGLPGFEYGISNLQSLSVSIQAKRILDQRYGLADEQQLANKGVYGSWFVRYSNQVMDNYLDLSATMQGDLEGDTGLLFLGADYSVNDHWQVISQIISITSKKTSSLAIFDQDLRLGLIVI
jgi:hypothetical protein